MLHPFLLAMYVVLAPVAQNIDIVGLQAIRSLLAAIAAVFLLTLVLRLILRDPVRAGLATSGFVLWFGSYGHVADWLGGWIGNPGWLAPLLLVLGLAAAATWGYWVVRRLADPAPLNSYLNLVGLIALVFPMWTIVAYRRVSPQLDQRVEVLRQALPLSASDLAARASEQDEPPPDIYYLVLDGYARQDVLQELYGFDNSAFIEELRQMGFYVPGLAQANHHETAYSIASSLNMDHLVSAPGIMLEDVGQNPGVVLREGLARLIHHSTLAGFLRQQGYQVIAFDSGYDETAMQDTDEFAHSPEVPRFNAGAAFELMLVDTTVGNFFLELWGREFEPLQALFDDHRARVRYGIRELSAYADRPGAQFVFSHVISPHSPYVFGPNGEPRYGVDPFTLWGEQAAEDWTPELYTDQVQYINSLVLAEVREILAISEPDPIIILQADHSSRAWGVPDPDPETHQKLLFPIMLAMYLPDSGRAARPYETISPVNIFRLVLNTYFSTDLAFLPDTRFTLAETDEGYRFVDACDWIGGCP
ncbi:MAG: hypothetical protein E4G99_11440 [Anaerolineales bacterium]|nr:MAG: hypothetical protein E4G99_11440 [Anaerolineales bacterium]